MTLKQNYPRLTVTTFGRKLIKSGDLDPLYIALWEAKLERELLCRWLLAYWCYYHIGLCCWIVDRKDFYGAMRKVARGGVEFPRGTERRHFRGRLAMDSIASLQDRFRDGAEEAVDWLIAGGPEATGVRDRVLKLHGFGSWICWKVPDMIERLDLAPIRFVDADSGWMFKSSLDGAEETATRYLGPSTYPVLKAHRYLQRKLRPLLAPPRADRPVGVQETETVFCKWKSHLGGHYPLGKDSHELRGGLLRYGRSRIAQRLLRRLPRMGVGG